jgi:hypothetical protein
MPDRSFIGDLRHRCSKPCFQLEPERLKPFNALIQEIRLKLGLNASELGREGGAKKGDHAVQLIHGEVPGIERGQLFKAGRRLFFEGSICSFLRSVGTTCSVRQIIPAVINSDSRSLRLPMAAT